MSGEKLERVVHENQLRPGLLVESRDCGDCGGPRCRLLLLGFEGPGDGVCDWHAEIDDEDNCNGWRVASGCPGLEGFPVCFADAIIDGTLYIVNPFDEQQTTTTKQRERSNAR